jgi:hypothetical protein
MDVHSPDLGLFRITGGSMSLNLIMMNASSLCFSSGLLWYAKLNFEAICKFLDILDVIYHANAKKQFIGIYTCCLLFIVIKKEAPFGTDYKIIPRSSSSFNCRYLILAEYYISVWLLDGM